MQLNFFHFYATLQSAKSGSVAMQMRLPDEDDGLTTRILEAIANHPDGLSTEELSEKLGINMEVLQRIIGLLFEEDKIAIRQPNEPAVVKWVSPR